MSLVTRKDGPDGLLAGIARLDSVPATGRCEPPVWYPGHRGERLGPAAPTPRGGSLFLFRRGQANGEPRQYHPRGPVTSEKQALLFNAIPLLVLAALYLAASAALAPTVWRERRQVDELELATALSFPAFGIAAGVLGVLVLVEQRPLGGHVWSVLVIVLVALVPPLLVLLRGGDSALTVARGARLREIEERSSARGRGLHSVAEASSALAHTRDEVGVARVVVDAVEALLKVEFVSVTLVSEDDHEARGI